MASQAAVTSDDQPYRDRRMTLAQHLVELRRRLVIAAAALVVGMVVAFFVTDPIIAFLLGPISEVAERLGDDFTRLVYTGVTSSFDMRMRIAFAIGLLLSAPVWLWQIWAYIMPGLTKREVRYTIGFMASAVPLFFAGCYVGVLIMPHILLLMSSFVPDQQFASQFYEAAAYYDFAFKTVTVIGIAFVSPVFLVALNLAGIVSGMEILKAWRVAIIVATAFAAVSTPAADIASMLLLAGVLVVLYFCAVGISLLFDRRKRKREQALLAEES